MQNAARPQVFQMRLLETVPGSFGWVLSDEGSDLEERFAPFFTVAWSPEFEVIRKKGAEYLLVGRIQNSFEAFRFDLHDDVFVHRQRNDRSDSASQMREVRQLLRCPMWGTGLTSWRTTTTRQIHGSCPWCHWTSVRWIDCTWSGESYSSV